MTHPKTTRLELAWETFDFHVASCINKELDLVKYTDTIKDNLKKISTGTTQDWKRRLSVKNMGLYRKLSTCTNLLVNDYKKQNITLDELMELIRYHKKYSISHLIPSERQVHLRYLHELKNTNSTLIEHLILQKNEIKSLLG